MRVSRLDLGSVVRHWWADCLRIITDVIGAGTGPIQCLLFLDTLVNTQAWLLPFDLIQDTVGKRVRLPTET